MMELKRVKADYKAGKLTKAEYEKALKDLLNGAEISEDTYNDALAYDADSSEKAIYTQADVDKIVLKKALNLIRKEAKNAGLEVEADNNALISKLVEMAKSSEGKHPSDLEKELVKLRKVAANEAHLSEQNKKLTVELVVMKTAAKYNPVNPTQIIRALQADYSRLLEHDDESGEIDQQSVARAIKSLYEQEPNLFLQPTSEEPTTSKAVFVGKKPGGSTVPVTTDSENAEKKVAEALKLLGITPKT